MKYIIYIHYLQWSLLLGFILFLPKANMLAQNSNLGPTAKTNQVISGDKLFSYLPDANIPLGNKPFPSPSMYEVFEQNVQKTTRGSVDWNFNALEKAIEERKQQFGMLQRDNIIRERLSQGEKIDAPSDYLDQAVRCQHLAKNLSSIRTLTEDLLTTSKMGFNTDSEQSKGRIRLSRANATTVRELVGEADKILRAEKL